MQKIMYETVEYGTIEFVIPFSLPLVFCVFVSFALLLSWPLVNPAHITYSFQCMCKKRVYIVCDDDDI